MWSRDRLSSDKSYRKETFPRLTETFALHAFFLLEQFYKNNEAKKRQKIRTI